MRVTKLDEEEVDLRMVADIADMTPGSQSGWERGYRNYVYQQCGATPATCTTEPRWQSLR